MIMLLLKMGKNEELERSCGDYMASGDPTLQERQDWGTLPPWRTKHGRSTASVDFVFLDRVWIQCDVDFLQIVEKLLCCGVSAHRTLIFVLGNRSATITQKLSTIQHVFQLVVR